MDDSEHRSSTTESQTTVKRARLEKPTTRNANRVFCEHCNQSLSVKTFKRHRWLYLNEQSGEWLRAEVSQRSNTSAPEGTCIPVYTYVYLLETSAYTLIVINESVVLINQSV